MERKCKNRLLTPPHVIFLVNKPEKPPEKSDSADSTVLVKKWDSLTGGTSQGSLTQFPSEQSRSSEDIDPSWVLASSLTFIDDLRRDVPLVAGEKTHHCACLNQEDSVMDWVLKIVLCTNRRECKLEKPAAGTTDAAGLKGAGCHCVLL
jgi:hypothetical protein